MAGAREARVARATEQDYLARLEADLVTDSARLADRVAAEQSTHASASAALTFAEAGWATNQDTDAVLAAYHRAGFVMDDNRKEQLWYRYRPALSSYFPAGYLNRETTGQSLRPFPPLDFAALRADGELPAGLKSAAGLAEIYEQNLRWLRAGNAEVLAAVRGGRADQRAPH